MSSRLFGVGISGTELTGREREILARHRPYGVILFRRNIESVPQLQALIADVREAGAELLFVDQEGGRVDRLRDLLGPSPSFGRTARAGAARRAGELAGAALAGLGFDVDLAPVVDRGVAGAGALVLGDRCASDDATKIVRAASEFLDGLQSRGVGGCLKHFPGLGRARLDTHEALPILDPDPSQEAFDLAPFDALMSQAGAVMISHAAGPERVPASLSHELATGVLRGPLGFEGAAFSDDLEMGALDAFGSLPERAVRAALAGCDLLFLCERVEAYPSCVEAVERSVPITRRAEAEERLDVYARHIGRLRTAAARSDETLVALAEQIRAFDKALA